MNAEKVEKTITETILKLEKLKSNEKLVSELSWCWVSFKNDNNPTGLIQKAQEAVSVLKEAREKNSKAVTKKLIDDLEKALN